MVNDPSPSSTAWIGTAPEYRLAAYEVSPPVQLFKQIHSSTTTAQFVAPKAPFRDVLLLHANNESPKKTSSPLTTRRGVFKSLSDDSLAYSLSSHCRAVPQPGRHSFRLEALLNQGVMISISSDLVEAWKSPDHDMDNHSTVWSQCTVRLPRITTGTLDCDNDTVATYTTLYNPAKLQSSKTVGKETKRLVGGNDVEWMPPPPRAVQKDSLRLLLKGGDDDDDNDDDKEEEEDLVILPPNWSPPRRHIVRAAATALPTASIVGPAAAAEDVQWTPPMDTDLDVVGQTPIDTHVHWDGLKTNPLPVVLTTEVSNGTAAPTATNGTNQALEQDAFAAWAIHHDADYLLSSDFASCYHLDESVPDFTEAKESRDHSGCEFHERNDKMPRSGDLETMAARTEPESLNHSLDLGSEEGGNDGDTERSDDDDDDDDNMKTMVPWMVAPPLPGKRVIVQSSVLLPQYSRRSGSSTNAAPSPPPPLPPARQRPAARPQRVLENVASGAKVVHVEKCRVRRGPLRGIGTMVMSTARVEL
jgi:hypothetical protein